RRRVTAGVGGRLLLDELAHPRADEADLHALPLLGDGEPHGAGEGPHLALAEAAQGEEGGRELLLGELEEVVALVLRRAGRGVELEALRSLDDPRVVAGRDPRGAQGAGAR